MIFSAEELSRKLNETYSQHKETQLTYRRFKHKQVEALINKLPESFCTVTKLGESTFNKAIYGITLGNGRKKVALWSQMHGNEPTPTAALFDIFNFLQTPGQLQSIADTIMDKLDLLVMPMINPDGADLYQRRTATEIDMNRDALRLAAPESKLLMATMSGFGPKFGFNLHDQRIYHSVGVSKRPATISFLAPAFNPEGDISTSRAKAMKTIAFMNRGVQQQIPGQVGCYDDEFSATSFGDNFQKMGIATMLIESGGYINDTERQTARRINFITILSALYAIATKSYQNVPISEYHGMTQNKFVLFDLVVRGLYYKGNGPIDIGIYRNEVNADNELGFVYKSKIEEIGDMSRLFGYEEIDATGGQITSDIYLEGKADFSFELNGKTVNVENGFVK